MFCSDHYPVVIPWYYWCENPRRASSGHAIIPLVKKKRRMKLMERDIELKALLPYGRL